MIAVAALAAAAAALLTLRPSPALPRPARTPRLGWLVTAVGAIGVLVASDLVAGELVVGPAVAAALVVGLGGRLLWRLRRRRQAAAATADRVLETCELLAAEVAAGQPPGHALDRAAAAWPVLAPAREAAALGGDLPSALRRLAEIPGAGELRMVGAAWDVAHRSGTGLAVALERVCTTVRADRATQRVVESELASARATARLIAALPVLVVLLGAGGGGGTWSFLTRTPIGWVCLLGGLLLGLLGLWWIERIAAGVVG